MCVWFTNIQPLAVLLLGILPPCHQRPQFLLRLSLRNSILYEVSTLKSWYIFTETKYLYSEYMVKLKYISLSFLVAMLYRTALDKVENDALPGTSKRTRFCLDVQMWSVWTDELHLGCSYKFVLMQIKFLWLDNTWQLFMNVNKHF